MPVAVSKNMRQRYLPQYQQFKVTLGQRGAGYFGATSNDMGTGSAWALPVSEHCLVLGHDLTPARDVDLLEITPAPYACASEVSTSTIEVMPSVNINARELRPSKTLLKMPACTFMTEDVGEEVSRLKQGMRYYSRAILFEPEFFHELDRSYPRQFTGLFEAFGTGWDERASRAICDGLHRIGPESLCIAGAHLYAKSVIGAMVAELAAEHAAQRSAEQAHGSGRQTTLVRKAMALADRELGFGHQLSIEELACRLYVSRTSLCAAFKQETGESLGAYLRHRRAERAEELLCDSAFSIAEVAAALGYPRPSSFAQAFKLAHGISPSAWRELNR